MMRCGNLWWLRDWIIPFKLLTLLAELFVVFPYYPLLSVRSAAITPLSPGTGIWECIRPSV